MPNQSVEHNGRMQTDLRGHVRLLAPVTSGAPER